MGENTKTTFETHRVHDSLYRVTCEDKLCGYVQVMDYGFQVRYKARLLHKVDAKLGVSLGEYSSLEEAAVAFRIFEEKLAVGEPIFDTRPRSPRKIERRYWVG